MPSPRLRLGLLGFGLFEAKWFLTILLFDVHDLFADAIQFGLEAEGIACDIHVRRLGGKGVGFAIHLLPEEIQITARIIVAVQKLRILNEM